VINRKKDIDKNLSRQGAEAVISEPNKIGASTPYDFEAKRLTAYGGLEDERRVLLTGFTAYLPKPVDSEQLLSVFRSWLHR